MVWPCLPELDGAGTVRPWRQMSDQVVQAQRGEEFPDLMQWAICIGDARDQEGCWRPPPPAGPAWAAGAYVVLHPPQRKTLAGGWPGTAQPAQWVCSLTGVAFDSRLRPLKSAILDVEGCGGCGGCTDIKIYLENNIHTYLHIL